MRSRWPKVNLYSNDKALVWMRAIFDEYDGDLVFEEISDPRADEVDEPEWLSHEVSHNGWEFILGLSDYSIIAVGKWNFSNGGNEWAIRNGVAPLQRFVVQVNEPTWHKSGGYDEPIEYEPEFTYKIVHREGWGERRARMAWEKHMKRVERHRLLELKRRDKH